MLVYPSGVDVSSFALRFLTQQLRQHRRTIGSRWQRLSAGHQAHRPCYSGNHWNHWKPGMNVQVIADPHGRLLWASPALPGAVHDIRAAREHGIVGALALASIPCRVDKGYRGAGGTIRIPCWGRWRPSL